MTLRFPDWPARLTRFLEEREQLPFAWGQHDCCLFACDWIREATGWDPAARFRGEYRNREGALRALRELGRGTLPTTASGIAEAVGAAPYSQPLRAQRGDIALIETDLGPALGVVMGPHIVSTGPAGLITVPLRSALRVWPL